ncbi:uncharacterized protein LOC115742545 [Rhodamnia argentea]|uniref:Uncharacterized protein LOC115742545 n=1 Tax=Rhodamnia argentea TaxID=178133 RepID=A0A8B8PFC1_9MYRT|nr:uncharacterized protein LOC115742545 [Rhodamnia argentea]
MGLVVYWYDAVCYGIVAVSFLGSLWVIWRKEGGSRLDDNAIFQSLLSGRPEPEGHYSVAKPRSHVDSSCLWTSCWRGVHSGWLLATRLGSLAVMGGFLAWDIVEWDATIFVYYTEWTFALVMVYFALGTVASAYGCWVYSRQTSTGNGLTDQLLGRDLEDNRISATNNYGVKKVETRVSKLRSCYTEEEILQRAGFWGYVMQIIYQTSAGAVILTDVVFWCIIVPFLSNARLGLNLLMGCMHTLNVFFLLIDTSLNSLPFPWFRLTYFVLWSSIYVIFQWVIHACGFSWWPYPFLEVSSPWCAVWYFAIAVVHVPCYGLYALITKSKNSIFSRLFPHSFTRSF